MDPDLWFSKCMKKNIIICPNGHRYRHTAYVSCPTCLNNDKQTQRAILKKNIKFNIIPDHYCGKLMYTEEDAKRVVKRSHGKFKGSYYCTDCDAYHVTKQDQHPSRKAWFESHPKQFRNKHV